MRYAALAIPVVAVGLGIALMRGAGCPSAQDLKQGVVFESAAIKYASIDMGDGLYWQGWQSGILPSGWQIFRYQGLFELMVERNSGALHKIVTYDTPLGAFFPLKVGDQHQYGEVATSVDREMTWEWRHKMQVKSMTQVKIGSCPYDALMVRFTSSFKRSDGMEKDVVSRRVYIPELRASFRPGKNGVDGLTKVRALNRFDGLAPHALSEHAQGQLWFANGRTE